ncbi:hypothetical protein I316_05808 [Kwoniella heveanensis BCC8398]|uniref:Uncharacterized protein n=1 Tax=Kwoniella heveanensis BCC8398 TaxID=1296120 RepID=A0A1B9GNM5_9TREE|nr:hypothetical protein I316_05808 [Kwoniella heveanensis BCC8398]
MDGGAPLTRSTPSTVASAASVTQGRSPANLASPANSPPAKRSLLARLRRNTSTPYPHPTHAASTSAIPMSTTASQDGERRSGVVGVKKNQVGVPIMMGVNRSEVFGPSTSIKHGFALEDEIEWQRVKTLPRVRLVPPPEDEVEPIMLYPPPHFVRPATPPPTLPHPFLSPPSSPPTSPPRRPGSPPQSPPRRPTSIYSNSPTWAGMADGFVLPPPKFTRTGAGWGGAPISMGVILPKKRQEVDEDRRRRMSGISINGDGWNQVGSPTRSPPPGLGGRMRSLESQEEIAANKKMRIERDHQTGLDSGVAAEVPSSSQRPTSPPMIHVSDPFQVETTSTAHTSSNQSNIRPVQSSQIASSSPAELTKAPLSDSLPSESMAVGTPQAAPPDSETPVLPAAESTIKSPVPKAVRKSRALSLSAAFSSSSSLKNMEVPPLPSIPPRPRIRKQKSLKQFFFSSSTPSEAMMSSPPPLPTVPALYEDSQRKSMEEKSINTSNKDKEEKEKPKGMKILQRARSKPSLKIDVKVPAQNTPSPSAGSVGDTATPITPALSTGRTEVSASVLETPSSATPAVGPAPTAQPRGLSKRFSLSNMSQAFKRKSSMSNLHASAGAGESSSAVPPHRGPGSSSASDSPVPMVPDLPEEYRKAKEAAKVGKKVKESAVPISPRKSKTLPVEKMVQSHQVIDMSLDEVLTPTGLPRRSESLKAIQSLSFGEADAGADIEGQDTLVFQASALTKSPEMVASPLEDRTVVNERDQALLPALDLVPAADRSASPVSISMSSASSIVDDDQAVEEEQEELVHAQLMHVSPRTRRDPSVSLQEFLAAAPSRTGSVVIVPKGVRRSVEAIVIGSAVTGFSSTPNNVASGSTSPAFTPKARESVVLGVSLDRVMERRGSETEEEDELATPKDEVVELFPEERVEPEEEVLLEQGTFVAGEAAEVEGVNGGEEDDGFELVCEPTPRAAGRVSSSTDMRVDNDNEIGADVDLDSLPSDTVLVETPPTPPPSQASPCGSTVTPIVANPYTNTSATKNRFASPEALLKRLSTSKRSQVQAQAQSTPYRHPRSASVRKDKKSKQERHQRIPIPPPPQPRAAAPGSAPSNGEKSDAGYSAMSSQVQLRSLHFDSLGLDFGGWDSASGVTPDGERVL